MENSSGDFSVRLLTIIDLQPHTISLILLPVFIVFLLISIALLGGAEQAMFSLSPKELDRLKARSHKAYKYLQQLLERPRLLLTTIAIIQIFFNVLLIGSLSVIYMDVYVVAQANSFFMLLIPQMILLTFLLVLVQYIIPKAFAEKRNVSWTLWTLPGLYFLEKIFRPLARLALRSEYFQQATGSRSEVQTILHGKTVTGNPSDNKQEMKILKDVMKFGNTYVKEIMKSRIDLVALNIQMNFDEMLKAIKESGYSRLPVYQENLDNIVGVLYTKDLLSFLKETTFENWQKLIRPAYFVPEGKRIPDLLVEFQTKMIHLGIVVDEYGSTAGIVTLEDIVEEIIGDIRDELDVTSEFEYAQLDSNNYVFEGKILLNDIYRVMNIQGQPFEEAKGDIDSLGGLVLELCGRIPSVNEEINYRNFRFKVLSMDNQRIRRVKVTRLEEVSN